MSSTARQSLASFLIRGAWIVACLVGCSRTQLPPVQVSGPLSSNDFVQVSRVVSQEMLERFHTTNGRPIKAIEVTTTNLYEWYRQGLAWSTVQPKTNTAAQAQSRHLEKLLASLAAAKTNFAVNVWYTDAHARWGEAGYLVEKGTNGWKVAMEFFR